MSDTMTLNDVYIEAQGASSAAKEGYNWPGEPTYETPPAIIAEVDEFESGGNPNYVSEDGKHFGLGAIGLPADSEEAAFYQSLVQQSDPSFQLTEQDLFDPATNQKITALGLAKRLVDQVGSQYENDWYAAAGAYAGDADANGVFDPTKTDPYTNVTGQDYYDAIQKGVAKDFPQDVTQVGEGRTQAAGDSIDSPGGFLNGVGLGGLTGLAGNIGKIAITTAFVIGGLALVISMGFLTSKALSDGSSSSSSPLKTIAKVAAI